MTELEARALVAEAMAYAGVHGAWNDTDARPAFLDGRADLRLDDLELDSLSTMEICIAIESHSGIELMPERLHRLGSLGGLARWLCSKAR